MKDTKYFIEITTDDERETLLKVEHVTGWGNANKIINNYKRYNLDNIKIDLYKEIGDNITHCGNFTNTEAMTHPTPYKTTITGKTQPQKKKHDGIILLMFGIVLFPIMIIYNLIKGE